MCDCCGSESFNTITCVNNHAVCYKCKVQYLKNFSSSDCMYCNPLNDIIVIIDSNNSLTRRNCIVYNKEFLSRFCLIVSRIMKIIFYIALFLFSTFYCTKTVNYLTSKNNNSYSSDYWINFDNFINNVLLGIIIFIGIIIILLCFISCIISCR